MSSGAGVILGIVGVVVAAVLGAVLLGFGVYWFVRLLQVLGKVVAHVFTTLGHLIADFFRLIGAVIVSIVFIPLVVLNVAIGRWSASAHYGRAFSSEVKTAGACLYRVLVGHPLRLVGLGGLTEGLEQRLPAAMAQAPGSDKPSKRQGMFEGYTIVGSLPGGGSGGRLYVAEPDALKRAAFDRRGHNDLDRVVIKTFSLTDGSSLPQIVRESRALDAAKKLGLVLEHELNDERFYYVMRYVPGDSLTVVTQRMHAASDAEGLDSRGIHQGVGYVSDLLAGLDAYHRGGLWHKDVKPDNVIVDRNADPELGRGKAHLVDFGLITPLRSAMTLTTHGTEYFRDPELVRQALRGVKVHQIDGARFDVYAAGAVLFSVIENSFPAHGGLSQISKRCPEALRWIVRRAMTDYDKRYATAREMLEDLAVVAAAQDPFAVKPMQLPSVRGGMIEDVHDDTQAPVAAAVAEQTHEPAQAPAAAVAQPASFEPLKAEPAWAARAGSPTPPREPAERRVPRLRVTKWWTGGYEVEGEREPRRQAVPGPAFRPAANAARPVRPLTPADARRPAHEQLANARRRVAERRTGAAGRASRHHAGLGPTAIAGRRHGRRRSQSPSALNAGIFFALLAFAAALSFGVVLFATESRSTSEIAGVYSPYPAVGAPPAPPAPPVPATPHIGSVATGETTPGAEAALLEIVPGPGRSTDGLGLVLITDFMPPYDDATEGEIERAEVVLTAAGVRLATNMVTEYAASIEGGDERLAELRALRGVRSLNGDLGQEISAFIERNAGVDAVWWVGQGEQRDGRRYLLATRDCHALLESTDERLDAIARAFVLQGEPPAIPASPADAQAQPVGAIAD